MGEAIYSLPFWPFVLASGDRPFGPVMIVLASGMLIRNVAPSSANLREGIAFSLKVLLPLSIVLLGARLKFSDIFQIGGAGIALMLFSILFVFSAFFLFRRMFGGPLKLCVLLAIGTAICGGSAIMAAAPVIRAEKAQIIFSVATAACAGLLLMFLLPILGYAVGLDSFDFALIAGLSIHQTPQVIAAGFAYGDEAGKIATVVKLARVCMLAPTLIILGIFMRESDSRCPEQEVKVVQRPVLPFFLYGFAFMTAFRTLDLLPTIEYTLWSGSYVLDTVQIATSGSHSLMIVSMAALGLDTDLQQLRETGGGPFFLACAVSLLLILALVSFT
jgi:uncharacterized integral membrane protein (TIGR00698 family)